MKQYIIILKYIFYFLSFYCAFIAIGSVSAYLVLSYMKNIYAAALYSILSFLCVPSVIFAFLFCILEQYAEKRKFSIHKKYCYNKTLKNSNDCTHSWECPGIPPENE